MAMAAVIHEKGSPDVFRWEQVSVAAPGAGEVRLRNNAVGVNYVDTYHRSGQPHPWPVPELPLILGFEGAGVIEAIGSGITDFAVGDRVAYCMPPHGAYSQERLVPADILIRLPESIDDETAAAMMLKGLTAQYLLRSTYRVKPGDAILVHAAAGGMGLILCQWGKALGATVIGTVSTDEKAELAKASGCDFPIVYTRDNFAEQVREITNDQGVAVVYESIGKATLQQSLDCLQPLGVCACYGHASGAPDPVDIIKDLGARGSLFITRPAIMHYMSKREAMLTAASELFDVVERGAVKIKINQRYPLREVATAHRNIESRATTGSTVLLPHE